MSTMTFDTLMYAKKLKEAGFTEQQAEVQAEAMKEIIDNQLATKQDILDLKRDMHEMEYQIITRIGGMIVLAVGVLAAIVKL
jgi:hypothetical protein